MCRFFLLFGGYDLWYVGCYCGWYVCCDGYDCVYGGVVEKWFVWYVGLCWVEWVYLKFCDVYYYYLGVGRCLGCWVFFVVLEMWWVNIGYVCMVIMYF